MEQVSQTQFEVMKGSIRDEKPESQLLHVVSGTAWVSMDGKDLIVYEGQEVKLSRGKYQAVVSNVGDEPVVYYTICKTD